MEQTLTVSHKYQVGELVVHATPDNIYGWYEVTGFTASFENNVQMGINYTLENLESNKEANINGDHLMNQLEMITARGQLELALKQISERNLLRFKYLNRKLRQYIYRMKELLKEHKEHTNAQSS